MRFNLFLIFGVLALFLAVGCADTSISDDAHTGELNYSCYNDKTCNGGLYCNEGNICKVLELINECRTNTDNCDTNAKCIDLSNGFKCECFEGFTGDGTNCRVNDLCDVECGENLHCSVEGECVCNKGYRLDANNTCKDYNECYVNNGDCEQVCIDSVGSFECLCGDGFILNEDGLNCDECGVDVTCQSESCTPECESWEECDGSTCKPKSDRCANDFDCSGGKECNNEHYCVDDPNVCNPSCNSWEKCESGSCKNGVGRCTNNYDCANGEICDDSHYCVDNVVTCESDCESWQVCESGTCKTGNNRCANIYDCGNGEICSSTHYCINDPSICSPSCQSWQTCDNGSCKTDAGRCANNYDCGNGEICESNYCVVDDSCTVDENCGSNEYCKNFVCTACEDHVQYNAGGFRLNSGEVKTLCRAQLSMNDDGNLVLYAVSEALRSGVIWNSGTQSSGAWVKFQSDGNMVIYKAGASEGDVNNVVWNTETSQWHEDNGYGLKGDRISITSTEVIIWDRSSMKRWSSLYH